MTTHARHPVPAEREEFLVDGRRFWAKVEKHDPDCPCCQGCWHWRAAKTAKGYGRFSVGSRTDGTRRVVRAHRFSFEERYGPIADGLQLDHLCRTPGCVNPDHLEAVTHRENQRRGLKGDLTTHCPEGHLYDESNTYRDPRGRRHCRQCDREDKRRKGLDANYRHQKAAASRAWRARKAAA